MPYRELYKTTFKVPGIEVRYDLTNDYGNRYLYWRGRQIGSFNRSGFWLDIPPHYRFALTIGQRLPYDAPPKWWKLRARLGYHFGIYWRLFPKPEFME